MSRLKFSTGRQIVESKRQTPQNSRPGEGSSEHVVLTTPASALPVEKQEVASQGSVSGAVAPREVLENRSHSM